VWYTEYVVGIRHITSSQTVFWDNNGVRTRHTNTRAHVQQAHDNKEQLNNRKREQKTCNGEWYVFFVICVMSVVNGEGKQVRGVICFFDFWYITGMVILY
jgi:hypothetical protein